MRGAEGILLVVGLVAVSCSDEARPRARTSVRTHVRCRADSTSASRCVAVLPARRARAAKPVARVERATEDAAAHEPPTEGAAKRAADIARLVSVERGDALERLRSVTEPEVIVAIVASLRRAALSAEERDELYACAARLDVPLGSAVTDPPRFARRAVYAALADDAVRSNDWSRPVDAFSRAWCTERDDIAAGFAAWRGASSVSEQQRAGVLAMRRDAFAAIYRGTGDAAVRRKLVAAAQGALDVLPKDGSAPRDELVPSVALIRELTANETNVDALWDLTGALTSMLWVPPPPRAGR